MTHTPTNQESAPGEEVGRRARKKRTDSMTQWRELGPRVPDRCEGQREVRAAWGPGRGFQRPSALPCAVGAPSACVERRFPPGKEGEGKAAREGLVQGEAP